MMTTTVVQSPPATFTGYSSMILSAVSSVYGYFSAKPVSTVDIVTPFLKNRESFENQNYTVDFEKRLGCGKKIYARKTAKTTIGKKLLDREKQCLKLVKSDHVVQMVDQSSSSVATTDAGMDLYEFMSKFRFSKTQSQLPTPVFQSVSRQFIQGLCDMHASGVTHNDLKPDNIAIDVDGTVRIFDLGDSSAPDAELCASPESGTYGYKAPEYYLDTEEIANHSDIFAAAATMFELLTGDNFMPSHVEHLNAAEINKIFCHDKKTFEECVEKTLNSQSSKLGVYKNLLKDMLAWSPEKRPTAREVYDRLIQMQ